MSHYHLEILRAELRRRKQTNPRYSLRSFARFLDIDPGNLSKIISQKKVLAITTAERLAERLNLDTQQRTIFLSSVWTDTFLSSFRANSKSDTNKDADVEPSANVKRVNAEFLRIINDWSDLMVTHLSETVDHAGVHRDSTKLTGSVSHHPVHAGEPIILTVHGVTGSHFEYHWSSKHGTIFGQGLRVNFQPSREFTGNAIVEFSVTTNGNPILDYKFDIPVISPLPKIYSEVTEHVDEGYAEVHGRIDTVATPKQMEDMRVFVYLNSLSRLTSPTHPPMVLAIDSSNCFSGRVDLAGDVDRIVCQLANKNYQPTTDRLYVDHYHDSKAFLPFRLNETDSLAFSVHNLSQNQNHEDPQIQNLLNRFFASPIPDATKPAYLVRSYQTHDLAFVYDQALAVLSFCHSGERRAATHILNALEHLQIKQNGDSDGGWFQSYTPAGTPMSCRNLLCAFDGSIEVEHVASGIVAWVVLAATTFQETFNDLTYQPMAERALNCLSRQFVPISFSGIDSIGVRTHPHSDATSSILSVQHNIIAHAALRNAGRVFSSARCRSNAGSIKRFIESMWDRDLGGFYSSYDCSKTSPNLSDAYMDPQMLAILAFGEDRTAIQKYRAGLDRIFELFFEPAGYLGDSGRAIAGFFDWRPMNTMLPALSRQFVWCEGTLGVILAMRMVETKLEESIRFRQYGHDYTAQALLEGMNQLSDRDGALPYCTENTVRDFQPEASAAATAWLYFANKNHNPLGG